MAFDQAVGATIRSWKLVAIFTLISLAAALTGPKIAKPIQSLVDAISGYFAMAVGVRIVRPEFRMTGRMVWNITGFYVYIIGGLALLAFVIPAVWVFNKWALAWTVVLLEGASASEGTRRSWEVTTGRFWRTLGFNIATLLPWYQAILQRDSLWGPSRQGLAGHAPAIESPEPL